MNCLPKELEDIILDYKYQIEHTQKFKKCLETINKIDYKIYENNNRRVASFRDDRRGAEYTLTRYDTHQNMNLDYRYSRLDWMNFHLNGTMKVVGCINDKNKVIISYDSSICND